jgi:hypothetical protein
MPADPAGRAKLETGVTKLVLPITAGCQFTLISERRLAGLDMRLCDTPD